MNALDPINLSIEFVKQTVDPGGGGGEFVNAQTGDIAIWAILAILFVGVIAYCMFRFSRVFNGEYATATASAKHAKNARGGGRLATTKAVLIAAVVGLIACLSMTATSAIAASNKTNANNVDIQPDKIQVTVDEAAGTINDATFNFVNNSQNYYLFDSTTKMELTSEVQGLTVAEDWNLQLTTLNTDLYKGAPNGEEYPVPDSVVTLYPGQSAQATLKFNKGSAELANTLIGKEVFSLTMLPDQYVVGEPQAQTGFTYDGTVHTAIAPTDAYTVTTGSATNAGNYQATVTLNTYYKWPDKSTRILQKDWAIAPRVAEFAWSGIGPKIYSGNVQHDSASVIEKVSDDDVSVDEYGFPEGDDGKSAGDHTVFVKSLKGPDKDNYTLEGAWTKYSSYTINPKLMTITADDKEKAIDDEEDPELTASVDGNIETEIFVKDKDYELSRETKPGPEVVGDEFEIYVKVKDISTLAKNYEITTTDGTLVIVDSKPKIVADSKSIVYGQQDVDLTATVTKTEADHPLVLGSDFTLSRAAGDDAKEYKISITLDPQSDNVKYYEAKRGITLVEGTYTIEKYSVAFTWSEFSGTYTKNAQYPTAEITTKAKATDVVSVKTYSPYDETYDCISAGDQKCKVAELDGADAENYSLDSLTNAKEYTIEKADIQMTVSVAGGKVIKPKGFQDTTLTGSCDVTFGPDVSKQSVSYQWYEADTLEGQQTEIVGATSSTYTIEKDSILGQKFYFLKVSISTTDSNFNDTSKETTEDNSVKLVYIKMTFDDLQTNTTTDLYTHYGTDELYESETGTELQEIPTASYEGFIFNGWYTTSPSWEGTQIIDYNNNILHTAVAGYISSEGKWANIEAKTLFVGMTFVLNYLTFRNEVDGKNTIKFVQEVDSSCNLDPVLLRYSTDLKDWKILEVSTDTTTTLAKFSEKGDELYVAGYNPAGFSSIDRKDRFTSTEKFSVSGYLSSLLDFTKLDDISNIPNSYCFQYLFSGCSGLTAAPDVDLTFTENEVGCYNHMFEGCSSLKYLSVSFEEWPENGFEDWVTGLNDDGTCEFYCPASLDWKCYGGNYCPKNWHNSKGEARWYIDENGIINFYVGGEKDPEQYSVVPIDNTEESPFSNISSVKGFSSTDTFRNWVENIRSLNSWFLGAVLINDLDFRKWNITNVTDTTNMFKNCSALSNIYCIPGENWNTSGKITASTDMFSGAISLPGYNPSKVDVSMAKSTNLGGYFTSKDMLCALYNDYTLTFFINDEIKEGEIYFVPLNSSSINDVPWLYRNGLISSINSTTAFCHKMNIVTSTSYWFYGFHDINSINFRSSDGTVWDTTNVVNTRNMFELCSATSIDVGSLSFPKLTDVSEMFKDCASVGSLDIRKFNTKSVVSFKNCFYGMSALTNIEFGENWDTSHAENLSGLFRGCVNFASSVPDDFLVKYIKTDNAKTCNSMFFNCENANFYLDYLENLKWDNIEDASSMFYNCKNLETADDDNIKISGCKNIKTFAEMFYNCCSSKSGLGIKDFTIDASAVEGQRWTSLEDLSGMFRSCTDLNKFTITNGGNYFYSLKSTSRMFEGCTAFDLSYFQVNALPNFYTHNVTDMSMMFEHCSGNNKDINLSSLDISSVTNMYGMFEGLSNVNLLNLSSWDTSKVTNFNDIFRFSYIVTINIKNFKVDGATSLNRMFHQCRNLTKIICNSDWSGSSAEASNMFGGCTKLPGFDSGKVGIEMAKPRSQGGYFDTA